MGITQRELILLFIPPNSQASATQKANEQLMATYVQLAYKIFRVPCRLCACVHVSLRG